MRRPDNFEGSFPLLLIGSVLVVYAGILASQQLGAHSGRLPLWGLLGGVGAVIVGAGIYSTFLEPSESPAPAVLASAASPRAVSVPASSRPRPPARASVGTVASAPEWWEGPSVPYPPSSAPVPYPPVERRPASVARPAGVAPQTPRPRVAPSVTLPRSGGRRSLKELTDELSELEAMVYGSSPPPRPEPPEGRPSGPVGGPACADCDRPMPGGTPPARCSDCHRPLCEGCEAASRSEDGEVRCLNCRSRDP